MHLRDLPPGRRRFQLVRARLRRVWRRTRGRSRANQEQQAAYVVQPSVASPLSLSLKRSGTGNTSSSFAASSVGSGSLMNMGKLGDGVCRPRRTTLREWARGVLPRGTVDQPSSFSHSALECVYGSFNMILGRDDVGTPAHVPLLRFDLSPLSLVPRPGMSTPESSSSADRYLRGDV